MAQVLALSPFFIIIMLGMLSVPLVVSGLFSGSSFRGNALEVLLVNQTTPCPPLPLAPKTSTSSAMRPLMVTNTRLRTILALLTVVIGVLGYAVVAVGRSYANFKPLVIRINDVGPRGGRHLPSHGIQGPGS